MQVNFIKSLIVLIPSAFGISLGTILLILGCALFDPKGWYSLFAIFLYLFAPIPDVLARIVVGIRGKGFNDDLFGSSTSNAVSLGEHMGSFFTAVLATAGIGLVCVLFHAGVIQWQTFVFEIIGGLIIALSIVGGLFGLKLLAYYEKKKSEEEVY